MRISLWLLALLTVAGVSSADEYMEVTAPANRLVKLAIAAPRPTNGMSNADVSRTLSEVLTFDLRFAGPFDVAVAPITEKGSGIRPGEFDFAPWLATGTELLVKSGYVLSADTVTVEFRLYHIQQQESLLAKRYTGKIKDLRKIAHTFCDDVMQQVTGEPGPFTSKIAFVSKSSGKKELYLMDYDGYNVQPLTQNGSINLTPDFSPNGRELTYTSYKMGNPDLYRREIFTGSEARVASGSGTNSGGAWSPDGNRIALSQSKAGNAEIYLLDRSGKELTRLTNHGAIDISPAWSPDGSQIAFVSDRLGSPQIFIMKADGTDVRRLTTSGSYNVSPRWSPKGELIAYSRQHDNGFQIHTIRPDGNGDRQITSEGSNDHPRWSPDGRFITYGSKAGGRQTINIMRADGSAQTQVSKGKGPDSQPSWSPRW